MNKVRTIKILSLVAAVASSVALALQGEFAQAGGVLAASLSSANLL